MAYIYQADIYCDDCGDAIRESLRGTSDEPEDSMDHSSYDSDNYPKSADVENEESDAPQHCAECGAFLRNPLTSDGYAYVQGALNEFPAATSTGKMASIGQDHLVDWAQQYGFRYFDAEDCADSMNPIKYPRPGWYSDESF